MGDQNEKKAILLLEDGTSYEGSAAGVEGTTSGELCFNTGMTGYQEIYTDPSYYGQVIVNTNVHIGNYGIKESDNESKNVQIAGMICKSLVSKFSRPLANDDIDNYFKDHGITCIHDVDTREIVKKVREQGAMNCIISTDNTSLDNLKEKLSTVPSMKGRELASQVCTKEAYNLGDPDAAIKIAVLDFGTKSSILDCFVERGAYLKVFPAKTNIEELNDFKPDGYFLSNGPGDPAAMTYAVDTVKQILEVDKPIFGICLGHQLLARAVGISTYKMHHGHRGINHPVKNLITGKCEITSQNHGFAVSAEEIESSKNEVTVTHMNLNDETIEGIRLKNKPAFSVQYHPEAAPGPHDSRYLFDQFIELIKNTK